MKKMIMLVGCIGLFAFYGCGGNEIGQPLGKTAIKDKNGVVVGYVAEEAITVVDSRAESFDTYDYLMQDINGNLVRLNLASGKLARIGGSYYSGNSSNEPIYFSTENCGGIVYINSTLMGFLSETYPFMTDSTKSAVDATASAKTYELTSIATGTERVESFLVLDSTYTDVNRFNFEDSNTNKYKCVTFASLAPTAGWGQCVETTGEVSCSDTIDQESYYNDPCVDHCSSGVFTPYSTTTAALPLTASTYSRDWGILTGVTNQDVIDKKAIVDYSAVAPLTIATFN